MSLLYALRRRERLRGRECVQRVAREGKVSESPLLVMRYLAPGKGRQGREMMVAVSRRCGGAVKRNRLKRLVREVYRHERNRLPQDGDFMFIVRSGAANASYETMCQSFLQLADSTGPRGG